MHSHTNIGLSTKCHTQLTNWLGKSLAAATSNKIKLNFCVAHADGPDDGAATTTVVFENIRKTAHARKLNDNRIRLIIIYKLLCAYIFPLAGESIIII